MDKTANKDSWKQNNYRTYVGPEYDVIGVHQLTVLVKYGLREEHKLLDVGCGSLRAGRFFILYLEKGNYYGIDPCQWLIEQSIEKEVSQGLIDLKSPTFLYQEDFPIDLFQVSFDFILAQSLFSHTPVFQMESCLLKVKQQVIRGAKFLATFVAGEEDYTGEDWVYPPKVPGCVTYRPETIRSLIRNQGMACGFLPEDHPNNQTWILITKD